MSGYLTDADGNRSSGRLVKVAAFIVAVALAFYGLATGRDASAYVFAFLGIAGLAETVQKVTGK